MKYTNFTPAEGKKMEQRKFNQPNRNQEWGEKRNKRRPQEIANAK